MVADVASATTKDQASTNVRRRQRQPREYVSRHFRKVATPTPRTPPATPARPRVIPTFRVGDLSSDSDLTDVPSDLGPDPFEPSSVKQAKVKGIRDKRPKKSPYFPNRPRPQFLSCLPFPALSDKTFGLMQERLAQDPFRLLIATIFLNKTPGERAMPVFYQLMARYPTVDALAGAEISNVTTIIHQLGFQNQRARKCVEMARAWVEKPPCQGKRTRKVHYPVKGDGRDIASEEVVNDDDIRVAWEISHLPGLGPYSHDSWRIFCRDELRGLSSSWLGQDAADPTFEPEWKRVVPTDKELRAYLTWMWLKEGWIWNKETGERVKADEDLMGRASGGGVIQEEREKSHLTVISLAALHRSVEQPAGEYMPSSS